MPKVRSLIYGGAVGAAIGVIVAPRLGESRRDAFTRLRLSLRPGRGSVDAFSGTPCSGSGPSGDGGVAGQDAVDTHEGGSDA